MKSSLAGNAVFLGIASGLAAVCLTCAAEINTAPATSGATAGLTIPSIGTPARKGYDLYMLNCAHCHGDDARGDEGPDLHGVTKSDARIAALIKNGIKGEMPKFSAKLADTDVQALVAFVRTLKEEGDPGQ